MPDFLADVLSRDHNSGLRLAVNCAKEWKLPPRQVIFGEPVTWNETDSRLAIAHTLLQAETCSECGTVAWHGHSTNNEIVFDLKTTTCYGCAELERHRNSKNKLNQQPTPGVKPYPVARMWDDSPLPSRAHEHRRRR